MSSDSSQRPEIICARGQEKGSYLVTRDPFKNGKEFGIVVFAGVMCVKVILKDKHEWWKGRHQRGKARVEEKVHKPFHPPYPDALQVYIWGSQKVS